MSSSANIRAAEKYLRDAARMLSSVDSVPGIMKDEIVDVADNLREYDNKGQELRDLPKHAVVTFQRAFPPSPKLYTYAAVKFRENSWRLSTGVDYDSAELAGFIGKNVVKVGVKWRRVVLEGHATAGNAWCTGHAASLTCPCYPCRRARCVDNSDVPDEYANEGAPFEHPLDPRTIG